MGQSGFSAPGSRPSRQRHRVPSQRCRTADWDDQAARDALVDSRARDGYALLAVLDSVTDLPEPVRQAMRLLATVLGQDLEDDGTGGLRIARKVAADRVISTVDPETRHGHKTNHRGFDGYKAHVALDPDSEVITATAVTAGNTGDAQPVNGLIINEVAGHDGANHGSAGAHESTSDEDPPACYGDCAYGAGEVLDTLDQAGIDARPRSSYRSRRRGSSPKTPSPSTYRSRR